MTLYNNTTIPTIILADGKFPEHELPLYLLKNASQIICCDGATNKLLKWGREPDAIVGDLDSLSDELKNRFADRIYYSADQETNDLTKAVEWCISKNTPKILILGATGLREDHMLGNISLLADYIENIDVEMITDSGIFTPITKTTTFKYEKQQQVSIFVITPQTKITTHGLKYAVSKRCFKSWWQGSLNESTANQFTIEIDKGKVIIFRLHTDNHPINQ